MRKVGEIQSYEIRSKDPTAKLHQILVDPQNQSGEQAIYKEQERGVSFHPFQSHPI